MPKSRFYLPTSRLSLPILGSLFLLSACASPATGPSAALKQQFTNIQQQQRQQAVQIKELQEQIAQLLQQTPHVQSMSSAPQSTELQQPAQEITATIPAAISEELTALTDSASSYLAAFSNLAAGRYAVAEAGFIGFLRDYPNHQYRLNALYWLASAQLSQGKLQRATTNLQQVVAADGSTQRAPAALALLAKVYQQQQLYNEADEALEQLRSRFPDSDEAQLLSTETEPQQQQ